MPKFRKKPIVIEAVRYGKDVDGSWYPGAVQRIAQFMLGVTPDTQLTDGQICDVLQPTAVWNPPEYGALTLYDGVVHHEWLPLAVGDWVIKGVKGEFYPCAHEVFVDSYDLEVDDGSTSN